MNLMVRAMGCCITLYINPEESMCVTNRELNIAGLVERVSVLRG